MKTHDLMPARLAGLRALPRAAALVLAVAAVSGTLLVSGCGKKEDKATQVAAKVNGDEITVHQLNFVLQRQRIPAQGPQAEAIRRQLLDRMIDQQLVVQKAEKDKFDHDPRVMQAVDAARRDIITQFYVEQLAEKTPKPTDSEVRAYYDGKPEQFAGRKVYVIQKVDASVPADKREEVAARLQSLTTPAAVTDYLNAQKLKFNVSTTNNPAEALGPMLAQIQSMKEGQSIARAQPNGVTAITLQGVQAEPVTFEQAKGKLEQQMWNERKRDAVVKELKGLKDAAKIEYVGAFAASAPAAGTSAPTAAPAPASAASGIDPAMLQKNLGK